MPLKRNPLAIKSITLEKLFGVYTYKMPVGRTNDFSRLLILYGDNGSGKTTILQLLFWILSTKDKSGYKSNMARTKFKKFIIGFENGIEIGATRSRSEIIGGFKYYVKLRNQKAMVVDLKADNDNSISLKDGTKENEAFKAILSKIKELNISVFYLSDDRRVLDSTTSSEHDRPKPTNYILENEVISSNFFEEIAVAESPSRSQMTIEPTISRLIDWIRTKTISGSKTGEKNSQVIYTDLIKNLYKSEKSGQPLKTIDGILTETRNIEKNITQFVSLGLIDAFDSKTILETIKSAKSVELRKYLVTMITPYLDSINAKLKALEKLKDTLIFFIGSVNQYFTNKILSFNLSSGFILTQIGGETISFNSLSSGEKQLLLLFIHTITATDQATIFIIDEPEISLNIKWQRKLINTLTRFSNDKNIQYILATHSIELLSTNLDQVFKLENANG
jgi:energy-coupling factor transporter ATP-binding protein EcfA2